MSTDYVIGKINKLSTEEKKDVCKNLLKQLADNALAPTQVVILKEKYRILDELFKGITNKSIKDLTPNEIAGVAESILLVVYRLKQEPEKFAGLSNIVEKNNG